MSAAAHTDPPRRRHGHSRPRGQFFTPPAVARFLWEVVELYAGGASPLGRVIDPAAGEGVLLDAGCDTGRVRAGDAVGLEIDDDLVRARGDARPAVLRADGLFDRPGGVVEGRFDIAVGNPPFGRSRELLTGEQRQRLAADPEAPIGIWGEGVRAAAGGLTRRAGSRRVEQLFLECAMRLVRDSGLVAFIVPDTLLSNRRERAARAWLGRHARLLASLALPAMAFHRPGLCAHTHLLLLRKGPPAPGDRALLMGRRHATRRQLPRVLAEMLHDLRVGRVGDPVAGAVCIDLADLQDQRWDAGFWIGRQQRLGAWTDRGEAAELGEFVELLTYGPIVTGAPPVHVPGGVPSIRQGDFTETGLRRHGWLRVAPGSAHDPARSRVRRGDLLLPRSGSGSLGYNRVAVYDEDETANVGCFVDLVRLRGLDPYYLWVFLRSGPGWGQIRSLINGVGTPNISFDEIRSLRVPVLPESEQREYGRLYRAEVRDLHRRGESAPGARELASARFRCLVTRLEGCLGWDANAEG